MNMNQQHKKLILLLGWVLHPDKRTITPTAEPNYKMAFFLTGLAVKAFTTNEKGEYPATIPGIGNNDYVDDLRPKATDSQNNMTMPF